MTREQQIADKCKQEGCSDHDRTRHFQLFVHERWDVHPSDEFLSWWAKHSEAGVCKAATGWNTDRNRKQFARWLKGEPEPEPAELTETQKQGGLRFLAQLRIRSHQRGQIGAPK